jgi:hypothetical protein
MSLLMVTETGSFKEFALPPEMEFTVGLEDEDADALVVSSLIDPHVFVVDVSPSNEFDILLSNEIDESIRKVTIKNYESKTIYLQLFKKSTKVILQARIPGRYTYFIQKLTKKNSR